MRQDIINQNIHKGTQQLRLQIASSVKDRLKLSGVLDIKEDLKDAH